jgi:hypothetical protein
VKTLRERCDPDLATIRNALSAFERGSDLRRGIEEARYNVYAALERNDLDAAERWLETLRDAGVMIPDSLHAVRAAVVRATTRLREEVAKAKPR